MIDKLRVGIIGTGGIANAHAGGYKGNLDKVDCVSVGAPNFLHAPISIEALEQGKNVLCEKPMATSVADAK